MKRWTAGLAGIAIAVTGQGAVAEGEALIDGIAQVTAEMMTGMGAENASASMALLRPYGGAPTADTLGHVMLLSRAFDEAAWYFALAAATGLDAPTLNNLSTALGQARAAQPDTWSEAFTDTALLAATRATELAPDNAVAQNSLGNALTALGRAEEALAAYWRATELDPDEPLFWTNLSDALAAAGDEADAAEALARANALAPAHPAVLFARADRAGTPAYDEALRRNCEVDYRCDDICPKSIIGGLLNVQCEMENMSARVACSEGRPFAPSYNCKEDFPEWGILIPGLNSGFTVIGPGFKVHILFDGDGGIRFEGEAGVEYGPVGAGVTGGGEVRPDTGDVVIDKFGGKVDIGVLPGSIRGIDVAGDARVPLGQVEVLGQGGVPTEMGGADFDNGFATY